MPIYQLSLAFAIGLLLSYGLASLVKAFFVTRQIDDNFWLGFSLITGALYSIMEFLLSVELAPELHLLVHRIQIGTLLLTMSGWVHTIFRIYFPKSHYSKIFAVLSGIVLLLVPLRSFLDHPVIMTEKVFLGIKFVQYTTTTGPAYLALGLLVFFPFAIYPIYRFLEAKELSRIKKLIGISMFFSGLLAALNDFAVSEGIYDGLYLTEYVIFPLLIGVSIHLFNSESGKFNLLKKLTIQLEDEVNERTIELEKANLKLQALATTDPITGLYNRREFDRLLKKEDARIRRQNSPPELFYSLLFLDLDNFKFYNDSFGHRIGDSILAEFAKTLLASIRASDIAARYGGDEFVVLLPETNEKNALILAERILENLREASGFQALVKELTGVNHEIPVEKHLGCSIGLTPPDLTPEFVSGENRISAADQAMYTAKNTGKDRVVVWRKASESS